MLYSFSASPKITNGVIFGGVCLRNGRPYQCQKEERACAVQHTQSQSRLSKKVKSNIMTDSYKKISNKVVY